MAKSTKQNKKASATAAAVVDAPLYECVPVNWLWLPAPLRKVLGHMVVTIFSLTFLSVPISLIFVTPYMLRNYPIICGVYLSSLVMSMLLPLKEWEYARVICQLTYELYGVSCNLSPKEVEDRIQLGQKGQYIIGMHPHGIVPIQALIWCAYCDQYMSEGGPEAPSDKKMYGFGAAADVVMYVPFLRNVMGWLSGGPATYKALKDGLCKGDSPIVNRAGRTPKHLYILPGGVAEVFTSTPGKDIIVFGKRRGLCRLALETGASLFPCYVFGGTSFFNNLATGDGLLSKFSRKMQMGLTIFYGHFGLPIPFSPRVTLCLADPIEVTAVKGVKGEDGKVTIPQEAIEELHQKYIQSITEMFNRYKVAAGYPDAVLEVQ